MLAPGAAAPLHCPPADPRRDGGTGRREGLKNLWATAHGGSIPPPGTNTPVARNRPCTPQELNDQIFHEPNLGLHLSFADRDRTDHTERTHSRTARPGVREAIREPSICSSRMS